MRSKSEKRRYTSARERAEKQKSAFSSTSIKIPEGVQLFQPKPGRYLIDILPFVAGEGNPWADPGNLHWERTYYAHRGIGANGDTYICPRMVNKKNRCPVCEARLKLMKEGDEDNEELVKDLAPKQRQLFNIINLKDPDKGVQLWDISYHLFGKFLDARLRNSDEEDEWDKFFFLEDGLTLKVAFAEKSFGGYSFVEVESIDFRTRQEPYDDEILEKVHCLDDLLIVPEYDELKKSFLEARDDDDKEDDDEDDEPKSKKSKHVEDDDDDEPKSSRRGSDDDEDDDDEPKSKKSRKEDDDDDDEEEEPKKKKKAPADDDDWDDFDDDDDEPKKKKKPAADDDDDEGDSDDDEDDDEDKKSKSKKSKHDDDDWEDEDDEPKSKKTQFPRGKSHVKAGKDDDEDDE